MLEREIAVMKKLDHPNVVRLVEVINDPHHRLIYLVQEYVEKGTIMKEGWGQEGMDEELARKYMRGILRGLEYLHFQNVVHQDLKPENLLLASDDTIKISDFGTAKVIVSSDGQNHRAMGTPAFMAPELFGDNYKVFLLTEHFVLEYPYWLNISCWNIPTE
jgi:[calcium/calmodulin-dependent protein kinase] kinase